MDELCKAIAAELPGALRAGAALALLALVIWFCKD